MTNAQQHIAPASQLGITPATGSLKALATAATGRSSAPAQLVADTRRRIEARAEPRFQVRQDRACLWVVDALSQRAHEARLLDVSCSGLGVVVEDEIPVGSWIRVDFGDVAVFGEVRYCRQQSVGHYRVGAASDWVIGRADLTRWGGRLSRECAVHLTESFRRMKMSAQRYGPPV